MDPLLTRSGCGIFPLASCRSLSRFAVPSIMNTFTDLKLYASNNHRSPIDGSPGTHYFCSSCPFPISWKVERTHTHSLSWNHRINVLTKLHFLLPLTFPGPVLFSLLFQFIWPQVRTWFLSPFFVSPIRSALFWTSSEREKSILGKLEIEETRKLKYILWSIIQLFVQRQTTDEALPPGPSTFLKHSNTAKRYKS